MLFVERFPLSSALLLDESNPQRFRKQYFYYFWLSFFCCINFKLQMRKHFKHRKSCRFQCYCVSTTAKSDNAISGTATGYNLLVYKEHIFEINEANEWMSKKKNHETRKNVALHLHQIQIRTHSYRQCEMFADRRVRWNGLNIALGADIGLHHLFDQCKMLLVYIALHWTLQPSVREEKKVTVPIIYNFSNAAAQVMCHVPIVLLSFFCT